MRLRLPGITSNASAVEHADALREALETVAAELVADVSAVAAARTIAGRYVDDLLKYAARRSVHLLDPLDIAAAADVLDELRRYGPAANASLDALRASVDASGAPRFAVTPDERHRLAAVVSTGRDLRRLLARLPAVPPPFGPLPTTLDAARRHVERADHTATTYRTGARLTVGKIRTTAQILAHETAPYIAQ